MKKEEILELVLSSGSDHVPTFGGRYDGGHHIQQVPEEITDCLFYLVGEKANINNYAEIGSAGGGTTFLICTVLEPENVLIVDDNQHSRHVHRAETLKEFNVKEFIGNSQGPEAKQFVANQGYELDMLFIDADHSYEGVKADVANYIEFVRVGGYIALHDAVQHDGVRAWCNEMRNMEEFKHLKTFGSRLGIDLFQKVS